MGNDWAKEQIQKMVRYARAEALGELEDDSPFASELQIKIEELYEKQEQEEMERMQ